MIEIKDKLYASGITIAVLLSVFGFIPEQNSTHICITDDAISAEGEFVRLSGTGITAYPNEDDNKGYKRCYSGWVSINKLIQESPKMQREICHPLPTGCKPQ